jgi:hypothetical protein
MRVSKTSILLSLVNFVGCCDICRAACSTGGLLLEVATGRLDKQCSLEQERLPFAQGIAIRWSHLL